MNKQQKQIIITAVLVVVLAIVWINTFNVIKKRKTKGFSASATAIVESDTAAPKIEQPIYPKEASLVWSRCPFSGKFYSGNQGVASDLGLAGILWDKEKPQAIINNEVVSKGGSVGGYSVLEIKKDRVVLSDGSNVFELKLEDFVK